MSGADLTVQFNVGIAANPDLTSVQLIVKSFNVDTGALLDSNTFNMGDVSAGFLSGRFVSLPNSDGCMVRIEISWLNGATSSGATIEFDFFNIIELL
jgi:hypothetical protein